MDLTKYVAISGLPGLYKMVKNRPDGLVVEDFINNKKRFISARRHNFTPLDSISIYTEEDTVDIKKVFTIMNDMEEAGDAPIDVKSSDDELREYFMDVLPDHDASRVYINDIKKVIKWYLFLKEKNLVSFEEESESSEKA